MKWSVICKLIRRELAQEFPNDSFRVRRIAGYFEVHGGWSYKHRHVSQVIAELINENQPDAKPWEYPTISGPSWEKSREWLLVGTQTERIGDHHAA